MQKKKTRVAILGGGISGLSLGYYLSQAKDRFDLFLLEKSTRLGGWLQTETDGDFLFEKGPRTFKLSNCAALLDLVKSIGLEEDIIYSSPSAHKRYVWANGALRKIPSFWFFSRFFSSLLKEWAVPRKLGEKEESVWDFAHRRFNKNVAEYFFDPLVTGIYAGSVKKISIQAAFPLLDAWEKQYGSLTKALFKERKKKSPKGLFSFQGGTTVLIDTLKKQFQGEVFFNCSAKKIEIHGSEIEIKTERESYRADIVICALPVQAAASLFNFPKFSTESLSVINIGYRRQVLPLSCFGYLVPSLEQQKILGVIFDSEIFPQQNRSKNETRLTVMTRGTEISDIVKELKEHLKITALPDLCTITKAEDVIPQYELGHLTKVAQVEQKMEREFPRCFLIGNYLRGASVNACVMSAKRAAEQLLSSSIV